MVKGLFKGAEGGPSTAARLRNEALPFAGRWLGREPADGVSVAAWGFIQDSRAMANDIQWFSGERSRVQRGP